MLEIVTYYCIEAFRSVNCCYALRWGRTYQYIIRSMGVTFTQYVWPNVLDVVKIIVSTADKHGLSPMLSLLNS